MVYHSNRFLLIKNHTLRHAKTMANSKKESKDKLLKNAAEFWKYLIDNAGLDSDFYDTEILKGSASNPGLYQELGISPKNTDFVKDLEEYGVLTEQLIPAFFRVLQPYSRMLSDICEFFEKHEITETNKKLRIEFNFDELDKANINFNLEHFREMQANIGKFSGNVMLFNISATNDLWRLIDLFGGRYNDKAKQPDIVKWTEEYESGKLLNGNSIISPKTGNLNLDRGLNSLIGIWRSFVNSCFFAGISRDLFQNSRKKVNLERDGEKIFGGWSYRDLFYVSSDRWPATFLNALFGKLERLASYSEEERLLEYDEMARSVNSFLAERLMSKSTTFANEFLDILKLPIWNQRHELYAAWVLTLIDTALSSYERTIHHNEGTLLLSFKATHLATVETNEGPMELWSEVRSSLKSPTGKGRKGGIQPDYTFYTGTKHMAENGKLVIEVKQYRTPSITNFQNAINDYANGLPQAHICLVNYGTVPKSLILNFPDRSTFLGQITPVTEQKNNFIELVQSKIPFKHKEIADRFNLTNLDLAILLTTPIDCIYVDISGSLNTDDYKEFLKTFITFLIDAGKVRNLVAVGTGIENSWQLPSESSVKELVSMNFDSGTSFSQHLEYDKNILVISDNDGISQLRYPYQTNVMTIEYADDEPIELKIIEF